MKNKEEMDPLCRDCWNDACKRCGNDFMKKKLPTCRYMSENPEIMDNDIEEEELQMSYIGGGPYYAEPCPECGATLWNGRCENPDCKYHWTPKEDDEDNDE